MILQTRILMNQAVQGGVPTRKCALPQGQRVGHAGRELHSRRGRQLGAAGERTKQGCPQRGHDAGASGLGKKACVLCGASDLGECFCEVIDGTEDAASVSVVLGEKLGEANSVVTDGRSSCGSRALGGRSHESEGSRELEAVNSPHSRLKAFIARFSGVSNCGLQRYLDWFC